MQKLIPGELDEMVRQVPVDPFGFRRHRGRRSLAGFQGKLLLCKDEQGSWAVPLGNTPSAYILKPDLLREGSASDEAYCLSLANRLGLTSIQPELFTTQDGIQVLAVNRYDRYINNGLACRLHQEDTAQALVTAIIGDTRYEGTGGRSLREVAAVVRDHCLPDDLPKLLRYTTFNVAIGNADAHSRNLSVIMPPEGSPRLAPLYDVGCTVLRPVFGNTAAMFVNGQRDITQITGSDLVAEASSWGIPRTEASDIVANALAELGEILVRPKKSSRQTHATYNLIVRRCRALKPNSVPDIFTMIMPRGIPEAHPSASARCVGTLTRGVPCSYRALPDSAYCGIHKKNYR